MYSGRRTAALPALGFPIRISPDQCLVSGSPTLFAATHVLLRLLSPRHPSCALCSLVSLSSRPRTRVAKTNVQSGRRFRRADPGARFLTMYETRVLSGMRPTGSLHL